MSLGAQWYILFNTIAGAQSIPSDLKDAMDNLGVHGWQRWKRLILPAIFPSYVTGGITASGGRVERLDRRGSRPLRIHHAHRHRPRGVHRESRPKLATSIRSSPGSR